MNSLVRWTNWFTRRLFFILNFRDFTKISKNASFWPSKSRTVLCKIIISRLCYLFKKIAISRKYVWNVRSAADDWCKKVDFRKSSKTDKNICLFFTHSTRNCKFEAIWVKNIVKFNKTACFRKLLWNVRSAADVSEQNMHSPKCTKWIQFELIR